MHEDTSKCQSRKNLLKSSAGRELNGEISHEYILVEYFRKELYSLARKELTFWEKGEFLSQCLTASDNYDCLLGSKKLDPVTSEFSGIFLLSIFLPSSNSWHLNMQNLLFCLWMSIYFSERKDFFFVSFPSVSGSCLGELQKIKNMSKASCSAECSH